MIPVSQYEALSPQYLSVESWSQSALNALDKGVLLVSRIGLLIFDECHHARRNHPYRGIMRTLDDNVKRLDCDSPKILGLSASIVTRYIEYNCLVHSSWNFMLVYNLVVILDS